MSKLRTQLRQTAQGSRGRSIGFASSSPTQSHTQLLVAAITDDPAAVPELIEAGAGAIVTTSFEVLESLVAAAGDIPVGIRNDATTAEDAKRIIAAGGDFIAFDHTQTHAEALLDPELGRVLLLEHDISEELLRIFASMQLDAIIVAPPPQPLIVSNQVALRRIVDLTNSPLVVPAAEIPTTSALHAWRNSGTMAVLVPGDADLVRAAVAAALEVPPPRQPRDERGGMALVPTLAGDSSDLDHDDF